jgi:hypothetical protein
VSHPPRWLEGVIHALLPPGSREHVLGDLSERYRSPGRYLAEALQALPGVIARQVRRRLDGTRLVILVIVGVTLFAVLGNHAPVLLAAMPPTLLGLTGLILREAYRPVVEPSPHQARQALLDVLSVAVPLLLSQGLAALWAPAWLLPASALAIGLPMFSSLLFVLSIVLSLLPGRSGSWPPLSAGSLSAAELLSEARVFAARARLEIRIEQCGALVMTVISLALLVATALSAPATLITVPVLITSIGEVVGAAGGLLAAVLLQRQARETALPLSGGMGFQQVRAVYRCGLKQQRQTSAHRWLYQMPTLLGTMIMFSGAILQRALPVQLRWVLWAMQGLVVAIIIVLFCVRRHLPDMLQRRLARLDHLYEKA